MHEDGERARRAVLGDAHVDAAMAAAAESTAGLSQPFQEFITEYAWGGLWTRPGLDRRTRSLVTIALLAALGRDELAAHVRATENTGATPEEILEVLLHVAVYAGVPAANSAVRVAEAVLGEGDGRDGGAP